MAKVLIIEDNPHVLENMEELLNISATPLIAPDLITAERVFFENLSDLDVIIMGACVPGTKPNVFPILSKIINSGYRNPIIAASANAIYSRQLVHRGATHIANKEDAPRLALELIRIKQQK